MGINRLQRAFQVVEKNGDKAFVPYIMGGDGGLDTFTEYLHFLHENGATAIEVGIPFSDPVADGPTIQRAGLRAMEQGVHIDDILGVIKEVRPTVDTPIVLMTYVNPILAYGIERFMERCEEVGIDGFIIPDLPYEEQELVLPYLREMALIPLVTLTSTEDRLERIIEEGSGFVYAVTVRGITGERAEFPEELTAFLARLREMSSLPVLAGFGISSPVHVKHLLPHCDGVVVGSKVIELFRKGEVDTLKELMQATRVVKN
ncbi:tryptophan synthase subunit alpha [Priestia taiwanensis]|uniref:Tryptophan synthase alpha chain n=1 Tax=Priestia taiwanensis TaxID=1347902 RepID=A0A917AW45_9BACI|nr:tryptophan synthase subunit alpha [Priestia taiwanensis]MBM7363358.1 tryptophan synthase alpha chain [Priestia taiwanensis]GGE77814.1 tryptophan synthase alpha chain [Priestia taiwanensis]